MSFDKADLDEVCVWMHDVLGYGVDPTAFPVRARSPFGAPLPY